MVAPDSCMHLQPAAVSTGGGGTKVVSLTCLALVGMTDMAKDGWDLTLSLQASYLQGSCHVLLHRESQGNRKGALRTGSALPQ